MCDLAGLTLSALLLAPPALAARPVADTTYAARLARASAVYDSLYALSAFDDSAYVSRLDTVRVGRLVLLAPPARLPALREAGDSAWRILRRTFGTAADRLGAEPYTAPRNGSWPVAEFTTQIVGWGSHQLLDPDSAITRWIGGSSFDSAAAFHAAPRAYVELLTAPWAAARACYRGDTAACGRALGLTEDDHVIADYSAANRRALVAQLRPRIWEPRIAGAYRDCQASDDAACVSLLRSLSDAQVPAPLSADARMVLVHVALEAGGPAAFDRLMSSAGRPLDQRFALAAGLRADALIQRWRDAVLSARPRRLTTPRPLAVAAVGWILLFAFAGTRSGRWR